MKLNKLVVLFAALLLGSGVYAQNNINAVLKDASTGEPVGFATVSLTKKGQTKPAKYVLSNENGDVLIESVRNGEYTFKAELLGYEPYSAEITVASKSIDLGEIQLSTDAEQLEAAQVSAAGNPIIVKKDTVEYNASSFKTAENDVLEDLLKKLPGIEVGSDGSISSNGQTITKITIDGKTFFLNDPQVASKNIPAKLVNKLKVIQKKSEQAEFTGIDDGREETVIDLSVMPGMMQGVFGRATAGAGKDIPSPSNKNDDFRYTGNAFIGRFRENSQISLILGANNTNGRGGTDLAGGMMGAMMGGMGGGMMGGMGGGMMGGGMMGGNGITKSYIAGINGAFDLLDNRMTLGGNYMLNHSSNDVLESSEKITYLPTNNLIYNSNGASNSSSTGHRFGLRLEHKFSENSSILFEPNINFGSGSYYQKSGNTTMFDDLAGSTYKINDAEVNNSGTNKNQSASGFLLYRQRLGLPGRTLTVMTNFNFSNNEMDGINFNRTDTFDKEHQIEAIDSKTVNQFFNNLQKQSSVMANLTYTEPIGNHFYLEGEYAFNWSKSTSTKETFDVDTGKQDYSYSNDVVNENTRHEIGANLLFQMDTFRAQLGFTAMPNRTYNSTYQAVYNTATGDYDWIPRTYTDNRVNFSPQAMVFGEFNDNANLRVFYRGNSQQPSTQQLMPVPDNTNPLNISFGNPSLTPYFSHNMNVEFRLTNRQTFFTVNARLGGGLTQNPIVNALWYGSNGAQYSMPFNGPDSGNANAFIMINAPIAKSNFRIQNFLNGSWSTSSSYVGTNIDMSRYPDPMTDYYKFMDQFIADHPDLNKAKDFQTNTNNNMNISERLTFVYSGNNLYASIGGGTRVNKSWVSISTIADQPMTWSNNLSASCTWDFGTSGFQLKADYDFRWYNGYTTKMDNENVLDITISKTFRSFTLALNGYDILGQSKNLSVMDNSNFHQESLNNTLGRYVLLTFTYNFGTMGRRGQRFGGPGMGGPGMMMGGPGMMGGGPGMMGGGAPRGGAQRGGGRR